MVLSNGKIRSALPAHRGFHARSRAAETFAAKAARPLIRLYRWTKTRLSSLRARLASEARSRFIPDDAQYFGPVDLGQECLVSIILHYRMLEGEDRSRRFNGKMGLPALVRRYGAIDWRNTDFIAFSSNGRIIGLAELGTLGPEAGGAKEVAFSVLRAWQGRGIGEALLQEAIARVCRQERKDLILVVDPGNRQMAGLAHKLGGEKIARADETQYVFRASAELAVA